MGAEVGEVTETDFQPAAAAAGREKLLHLCIGGGTAGVGAFCLTAGYHGCWIVG